LERVVEKAAHKNHVPVQSVLLKLKMDDAKGAVRDLGKIPQEAEIGCFTAGKLWKTGQPKQLPANRITQARPARA
jgi:hypothetical protein